jgi:nicotinate-nucleotide adenylyltransferase
LSNSVEFVFGGTFDPIHNGHLAIIEALTHQAPECTIRLIPCSVPALKSLPGTSFEQRQEMLSLATNRLPNIIIDQRESKREGASYMVDTLSSLTGEFPHKRLILVMGADSVVELTRWHQWQKLTKLCHLLVINRPGISQYLINSAVSKSQFSLCEDFQKLKKTKSSLAFLLKMPEKAESSTQIRQFRDNNLELDSLLPQSVIKYITSHHLYQ